MKISVCIPAYNRGHMITETLDRIFAQTRQPDEVIVVNDGSTDNTADVITKHYGDKVTLIHQENGGHESARRAAMLAATGDWIATSDSDDYWDEDHLERLVALHMVYPSCDYLFSNFREEGSAAKYPDKFASMDKAFWDGVSKDESGFIYFGKNQFKRFLYLNPVFPSAAMFRADRYREIGDLGPQINRVLTACADLTRRFASVGEIACDSKITVTIMKHGENISDNIVRTNLGRTTVLSKSLEAGGIYEPHLEDIRQAMYHTAKDVMVCAFSTRNMEGFKKAAAFVPASELRAGLKLRAMLVSMPALLRAPVFWLYGLIKG